MQQSSQMLNANIAREEDRDTCAYFDHATFDKIAFAFIATVWFSPSFSFSFSLRYTSILLPLKIDFGFQFQHNVDRAYSQFHVIKILIVSI